MFVVTNREVFDDARHEGVERFGKNLNPKGPNELRMAEVARTDKQWTVDLIPDQVTDRDLKASVGVASGTTLLGGEYLARRVLARVNPARARKLGIAARGTRGRNLLFFVHGFNNNMESVLNRAAQFESLYKVEVLCFSWPANGGGLRGVSSYKSDKRDAKASIGAADRVLAAIRRMLDLFNQGYVEEVRQTAATRFADDPEAREAFINERAHAECPFTVNAIFHSMGNYLYKHLLGSSSSEGTGLLFDNVVLAAADANNADHARWVDRIQCRQRVYVTINEDDKALAASRAKMGDEQQARLGHYTRGLDSRQGVYVQFTDVVGVGDSHSYFEGGPVRKNARIKRFFREALNGLRAEQAPGLVYEPATNMYVFR